MTYVRTYGRPDLFITMTCNPKWEMITMHLLEHQQPNDRQDVVARVFQQNVDGLWAMLADGHLFGTPSAVMYTIEWQKKGKEAMFDRYVYKITFSIANTACSSDYTSFGFILRFATLPPPIVAGDKDPQL